MNPRPRFYLPVAAFALFCMAGPAQAEIVFLTSGRSLNVKGHRVEGDTVVLQMRSGGEVRCDKTLVEKILPDEVPYKEEHQPVVPTVSAAPQGAVSPVAESRAPSLTATPYNEIITTMAQAHGVDPVLISALIQVESNYRPTARSHKGAMGLMQLMPSTARQYNVRNPYDPKSNIGAGVKHLKSLLDRLGAVDLALAAYNAGEGAVKKFNGIPPYRETRDYVRKILSLAGGR